MKVLRFKDRSKDQSVLPSQSTSIATAFFGLVICAVLGCGAEPESADPVSQATTVAEPSPVQGLDDKPWDDEANQDKAARSKASRERDVDRSKYWGGTLSETPSPSEFSYKTAAQTNASLLEAKLEYELTCLTHFHQRSENVLNSAQIDQVARFVIDVLTSQYSGSASKWNAFSVRIDSLSKSIPIGREPLFQLAASVVYQRLGFNRRAREAAAKAVGDFRDSSYPSRIVIRAHQILDECRVENTKNVAADRARLQQYVTTAQWWLENDFAANALEQRFVWESIESMMLSVESQRAIGVVSGFVKSTTRNVEVAPWLRAMIKGRYHVVNLLPNDLATIKPVKLEFEEQKEKLRLADSYFTKARKISPRFPESSRLKMALAFLRSDSVEEEKWFERTIDSQYDFLPVYNDRLAHLINDPTVDLHAVVHLANSFVVEDRFDTLVPFQVVEAYRMLRHCPCGYVRYKQKQELLSDPQWLENIQECLERLANDESRKAFSSQFADANYFLTLQACFADLNDDAKALAKCGRRLNGPLDENALEFIGTRMPSSLFQALISSLSGEHQLETTDLYRWTKQALFSRLQSMTELENVCSQSNDSWGTASQIFFESTLERSRNEQRLAEEQTVNLGFEAEEYAWSRSTSGQFEIEKRSSIVMSPTGSGEVTLASDMEFDGNVSIRFTIRQLGSVSSGSTSAVPFIVLGGQVNHLIVGVDPLLRRIQFRVQETRKKVLEFEYDQPLTEFNFKCNIGPEFVEVHLNDCFVAQLRVENLGPAQGVTIGIQSDGESDARYSFGDFRVVQWFPGPIDSLRYRYSAGDLAEYYNLRLDDEENNGMNWFFLALAQAQSGDLKTAVEYYKSSLELGGPAGLANLYLGDSYERLGMISDAVAAYRNAFDGKNELQIKPHYERQSNGRQTVYHSPANIAAFRYQWLCTSSADVDIRKSYREPTVEPRRPGPSWDPLRLESQKRAFNGDLNGAAVLLRNAITNANSEYLDDIRMQCESYERNEPFPKKHIKSFYLARPLPSFEAFEAKIPSSLFEF